MIVPDINLLVYAYNTESHEHEKAKAWLEAVLNNQGELIGIPWVVITGYIRLMTHPRIFPFPIDPEIAVSDVQKWLALPHVNSLSPGSGHLKILSRLFKELGSAGPLTTDAHIAAIAIEHGGTVYSNDTDFTRFKGLRHINPLS